MKLKGIAIFALLIAVSFGAASLEERIELAPGKVANRLTPPGSSAPGSSAISPAGPAVVRDSILGAWQADNAVAVPGFRGGVDYVLAPAAYRSSEDTDLLLHFEPSPVPGGGMEGGATQVRDEGGKWFIEAGRLFSLDSKQSAIGAGSASFRGPSSSLKLNPGKDSLLERSSRFRDFSIEFWLYPANAENGETILSWQSLRSVPKGSSSSAGGGSFPQSFGCTISGGRIRWDFQGFFQRASTNAGTDLMLRATNPLLPRSWSHHLLRFDGDTGLLEYVVNGVTEAVSFATASGHEGGEVFAPAVGAASPLILGADYVGLLDEFRISRSCIEKPNLKPFARDGGLVLSPVADLGFGNSRLLSVEMQAKTPGATGIELSYRISDEWIGWRYDSPAWIPFRAGDRLPAAARGRYVQIRAELYPDGTGRLTPSLSSLTLHYEPDPLPPPPARVEAIAKDGGIELRWSRVPESDVAGYLVYYGGSPGDYFGTGAAEGQSPIDVGNATSFTLTGLPNGGLVYLAVAVYDTGTHSAEKAWRAGEFSAEVSARPSRTAR